MCVLLNDFETNKQTNTQNPDPIVRYMTAPRSIPDYQLLAEVGNNMNMMNLMDVQDAAGSVIRTPVQQTAIPRGCC